MVEENKPLVTDVSNHISFPAVMILTIIKHNATSEYRKSTSHKIKVAIHALYSGSFYDHNHFK